MIPFDRDDEHHMTWNGHDNPFSVFKLYGEPLRILGT